MQAPTPRRTAQLGSMWRRRWPVVRALLGVAVVVLAGWVLSSHTDELSGLGQVLDAAWTGAWVVAAVGAEFLSFVSFARLQAGLLKVGSLATPPWTLLKTTFAAQALANSLPGGTAVSAVYSFRWYRRFGAGNTLATWAITGVVLASIISLALVATLGLGLATEQGATLDLIPAIVGALVATVALGALFLYQRPLLWTADRLIRARGRSPSRPSVETEARIHHSIRWIASMDFTWQQIVATVLWATANWLFDCACFALMFLAIGGTVPWKGLLLAYGAGQLATALPITPGGLGCGRGEHHHRSGRLRERPDHHGGRGAPLPVHQLLVGAGRRLGALRPTGARGPQGALEPARALVARRDGPGPRSPSPTGSGRSAAGTTRPTLGHAIMSASRADRLGRRAARGMTSWVVASSVLIGCVLGGCSTIRTNLGTSDSPCYLALPARVPGRPGPGQAGRRPPLHPGPPAQRGPQAVRSADHPTSSPVQGLRHRVHRHVHGVVGGQTAGVAVRSAGRRRPDQPVKPVVGDRAARPRPLTFNHAHLVDRRAGSALERPAQQVEGGDGGVLADPVPVAGHVEPERLGGVPGAGQTDEHRPGRLVVLGVGSGHPGDGEPDVGLEDRAGAVGHGPGRLLGHHRALGHAEDGELDLRGVGHHRAPEPAAGPGHVDQPGGGQSAGEGLGQPEGHPGADDRPGHGILDGLVVHAEHHVPGRQSEDPPDLGLLGIEQPGRRRVRPRPAP